MEHGFLGRNIGGVVDAHIVGVVVLEHISRGRSLQHAVLTRCFDMLQFALAFFHCWPTQELAVMFVGFSPVLLLALLAAVVEHLAPAAPQGDLALGLHPVVDVAICTNTLQPNRTSGHLGWLLNSGTTISQ